MQRCVMKKVEKSKYFLSSLQLFTMTPYYFNPSCLINQIMLKITSIKIVSRMPQNIFEGNRHVKGYFYNIGIRKMLRLNFLKNVEVFSLKNKASCVIYGYLEFFLEFTLLQNNPTVCLIFSITQIVCLAKYIELSLMILILKEK